MTRTNPHAVTFDIDTYDAHLDTLPAAELERLAEEGSILIEYVLTIAVAAAGIMAIKGWLDSQGGSFLGGIFAKVVEFGAGFFIKKKFGM